MLQLQLLGRDAFNAAMIAEGILFKDQVAPLDIQRITLQHQLFTLRRQQTGMVRGRNDRYRRHDNADEQAERQFAETQKIVGDHARQGMALGVS